MANETIANTSAREKSLTEYRKKLLEHRELEAKLKKSLYYKLQFRYKWMWFTVFPDDLYYYRDTLAHTVCMPLSSDRHLTS